MSKQELIPLYPKKDKGTREIVAYRDTVRDRRMLEETRRQRLEMELIRLKVEFAMDELEALSKHEAEVIADFIRFILEMKESLKKEPELRAYMMQHFSEALPGLINELHTYHNAYYRQAGEIAVRPVYVQPTRKPLLTRIVEAVKGDDDSYEIQRHSDSDTYHYY